MCQGNATIYFSLLIRAWTLIRAAKAHVELEKPLLALALILLRLRHGTLRTTATSTGAESLPGEIWDMIRKGLILGTLDDALAAWIRTLECRWRRACRAKNGKREWGEGACCGCCVDHYFNKLYQLESEASKVGWLSSGRRTAEVIISQGVNKLFGDYSLIYLSSIDPFCDDDDALCDPHRSWAISLPIHFASPSPTSIHTSGTAIVSETNHDTCSSTPAQAIISPDLFLTRPDTARFKVLISTYHLEVHAFPESTFLPRPLIAQDKDETTREDAGKDAGKDEEPKWRVATICWSCS